MDVFIGIIFLLMGICWLGVLFMFRDTDPWGFIEWMVARIIPGSLGIVGIVLGIYILATHIKIIVI